MTNNYYDIYIDNVISLAESIVIKSDYTAKMINQKINKIYPNSFDPFDKRTWKYYLNLAGEYHSSDKRMHVVSLDTLEIIEFNKENLATHKATLRAYQFGTRYFRELVAQYKEQFNLIVGILYPVDIDKAIEAKDYQILSYPKQLVEEQEYSLIYNLQNWIDGYIARWFNVQYRVSDDLYEPTIIGILYLNLVNAILHLRLEKCLTNEAHSFHLRQFLGSHGFLDEYIDLLTVKQKLFFYRNIRYIERNNGKTDTFEWLKEKVLTVRNIPLASFLLNHDTTEQVEDPTTRLISEPVFNRVAENKIIISGKKPTATTEEILYKEDDIAKDNQRARLEDKDDIHFQFTHSSSNKLLTKVLESAVYDYKDSSPYSFSDILLSHWTYMAYKGVYKSYVNIKNPKTEEYIPLSAKDALLFATYIYARSIGIRLDKIPKLYAKRVQMIPRPTNEQILNVVPSQYFGLADLEDIRKYEPELDPTISIESFYEKCRQIYISANYQLNWIAWQEDYIRRGLAHGLVSRLYADVVCDFTQGKDVYYADFFSERNIDISDFDTNNDTTVYTQILKEATGVSLNNTVSIKNIQNAMIRLMTNLSSYTLQYLTEINDDSIRLLNWAVIRPTEPIAQVKDQKYIIDVPVTIVKHRGSLKHQLDFDINKGVRVDNIKSILKHELRYEIPVTITANNLMMKDYLFYDVARVTCFPSPTLSSRKENLYIPVLGHESINTLNEEQLEELANITYQL